MRDSWPLPGWLPPGRLIVPDPRYGGHDPVTEPVLWITDEPVPDGGPLFARLLAQHAVTGLWPLLLTAFPVVKLPSLPEESQPGRACRPWHNGELAPVPPGRAGKVDAGDVLARGWERATGQGAGGFDFGEDAIPAVPFRSWPGLAAPGVPGTDPDRLAAGIAAAPDGVWALTDRVDPPYLGLVPAPDGAGTVASVGWMSQAGDAAEITAVIRSWQERFGVRLCSLGMDTVGVSVAWPPDTADHARRVAAEHFAFCSDLAALTAFDEYADRLVRAPVWSFWWD